MEIAPQHKQKTLTACIIGKPNAGKSSLLNKIIGQKISIVTHKVQTTRSIITGIVTIGDMQMVIFDTPGIFEPRKNLERAMVRCAWSGLHAADIVVLIIDQREPFDKTMFKILDKLQSLKITPLFIFNKIDLRSAKTCNEDFLRENFSDSLIFKISALTGQGVDKLLQFFTESAQEGVWAYESDDMTTASVRFLSSEITREQLFLHLQEELPYNLTVQAETWDEKDDSVTIRQVIVVMREGHKKIILGNKGTKIKEIGTIARLEIEKLLNKKVHLFLFVKVREEWQNNAEFYNYMGLKLTRE